MLLYLALPLHRFINCPVNEGIHTLAFALSVCLDELFLAFCCALDTVILRLRSEGGRVFLQALLPIEIYSSSLLYSRQFAKETYIRE